MSRSAMLLSLGLCVTLPAPVPAADARPLVLAQVNPDQAGAMKQDAPRQIVVEPQTPVTDPSTSDTPAGTQTPAAALPTPATTPTVAPQADNPATDTVTTSTAATAPATGEPAPAPEATPLEALPPGQIVLVLQQELKRVGCYDGPLSGAWDEQTDFALRAYGYYGQTPAHGWQPSAKWIADLRSHDKVVCPPDYAQHHQAPSYQPPAHQPPSYQGGYGGGGYGGRRY